MYHVTIQGSSEALLPGEAHATRAHGKQKRTYEKGETARA